MKRLILILIALAESILVRADDTAILAAVKAADDVRVAAMIAGDNVKLDEVLSERLHYGHSEKLVEDKAEHIFSLVSRRLIYQKIDYQERDFIVIAPGAVISKGRALVEVGGEKMIFSVDLHFLAVWRLENERWRLFAWQSTKIAPIVPLGPASGKRPNKAPEPTPTAVTPRAVGMKSEMKQSIRKSNEARVAPAVGVAHL